jgi:recombination protein RecA
MARKTVRDKIRNQLDVLKNIKIVKDEESPEIIPTGHEFLDTILGGFPCGRVVHIYGNPGSCKSLMAYDIVARVQKVFPDKPAVIIDTEGSVDKKWFEWLRWRGVKTGEKNLIVVDTNVAEDVFESAVRLTATGDVSVVVIDSIGNLVSKNEFSMVEENKLIYGTKSVAEVARIVTRGMKDLSIHAHNTRTLVIIINQLRDVISPFFGGQSQTTPGGRALKHIAHIALKFSRVSDIKSKGNVVGMVVKVRIDKSKVSVSGVSSDNRTHLKFFFDKVEGEIEDDIVDEEDGIE